MIVHPEDTLRFDKSNTMSEVVEALSYHVPSQVVGNVHAPSSVDKNKVSNKLTYNDVNKLFSLYLLTLNSGITFLLQ